MAKWGNWTRHTRAKTFFLNAQVAKFLEYAGRLGQYNKMWLGQYNKMWLGQYNKMWLGQYNKMWFGHHDKCGWHYGKVRLTNAESKSSQNSGSRDSTMDNSSRLQRCCFCARCITTVGSCTPSIVVAADTILREQVDAFENQIHRLVTKK